MTRRWKDFYEGIETALELHRTDYSFIIGDFNGKVGGKKV